MARKQAGMDFSKKCRDCDDAIALIWGLNSTDRRIIAILCASGGQNSVSQMAKTLKLTPGRIAQRLDYLAGQGIVTREKISLPKGYRYAYSSLGKKELAKLARARLEEKIAEMEQALGR
ncbi:MAG: MarR family transcriptional regulator [Candidatus Micrarchaeia archaeon]